MNKLVAATLSTASLAVLMLVGCATGPSAPAGGPADGSGGNSLRTASTSLGDIVVNGKGMSVYVYDRDTANSGTSACTGSCASQWPAVKATTTAPTVTGVTGTIGTINAVGGGKQVTINGLPIYTYVGDAAAGDLTGQGFGGIWWVVAPTGKEITQMATKGSGY